MSKVVLGAGGLSTDELFTRLRMGLRMLEKLMIGRRRRDQAGVLLSDCYHDLQVIGERLAATGGAFSDRGVMKADEEELERDIADHVSLQDMVEVVYSRDSEESQRVEIFNAILEYLLLGAKGPEVVTKRVLAIVRRMQPHLIERHFGLGQADVARALGEGRQTTQAREKARYEKPLKKAGARGYKGAGGARSEQHRDRCARAQRGNRSRKKGMEADGRGPVAGAGVDG